MTERRDLEALDRELKTRRSELESTKDKLEQAQFALEKHRTEQTALSERKAKLDERTSTIQRDLQRAKKEHQDANAERTKANQQVTELNEKLEDCYRKLGQAGADKKESEKEAKLKEVLKSLQRILPQNAVLGRVSDLCKPTQRKYDTAVSVVLGRNIDSVVVDTQKTAIECIEVSVFMLQSSWNPHVCSPFLAFFALTVPALAASRCRDLPPSRFHHAETCERQVPLVCARCPARARCDHL